MYEKRPTYACEECHRSFKNQRGLDAHNDALHAEKPVQDGGLAASGNSGDVGGGSDPVRAGDAPDLIIIDEAAEVDPKWFEKL